MAGFIFAVIAGAVMSIQGVFNTRVSDKIGIWESNVFVQGTAFIIALVIMLIWGNGSFSALSSVDNRIYLTGGILGVCITATVMLAVGKLSPALAVSAILVAQLLTAAIIDAFGLFGTEKNPFTWNKYVGIIMLIGGIILFKLNLGKK